jgi:hypothetical protein
MRPPKELEDRTAYYSISTALGFLAWFELSGPSASGDGDASHSSASHFNFFIFLSARAVGGLCATEKLWQALSQPLAILTYWQS